MEIMYALLTASLTCGWVFWLYLIMYEDENPNDYSVHQVETPQGQDEGVTTQEETQMQRALDYYLTQSKSCN